MIYSVTAVLVVVAGALLLWRRRSIRGEGEYQRVWKWWGEGRGITMVDGAGLSVPPKLFEVDKWLNCGAFCMELGGISYTD